MSSPSRPLAEFLLARIAEDEDQARGVTLPSRYGSGYAVVDSYGALEVSASRVLAECDAKRRIVEIHPGATDKDECPGCGAWLDGTWSTGPGELCEVLAALALPHAGHPDYRQEWTP